MAFPSGNTWWVLVSMDEQLIRIGFSKNHFLKSYNFLLALSWFCSDMWGSMIIYLPVVLVTLLYLLPWLSVESRSPSQFFLIIVLFLFGYVWAYTFLGCIWHTTLAGLLDWGRLATKLVSFKRFKTLRMVLCEGCRPGGKCRRYNRLADNALYSHSP